MHRPFLLTAGRVHRGVDVLDTNCKTRRFFCDASAGSVRSTAHAVSGRQPAVVACSRCHACVARSAASRRPDTNAARARGLRTPAGRHGVSTMRPPRKICPHRTQSCTQCVCTTDQGQHAAQAKRSALRAPCRTKRMSTLRLRPAQPASKQAYNLAPFHGPRNLHKGKMRHCACCQNTGLAYAPFPPMRTEA